MAKSVEMQITSLRSTPFRMLIAFAFFLLASFLIYFSLFNSCVFPHLSFRDCTVGNNIGRKPFTRALQYGPIDAVYTWVNGSDPRWKKEKSFWYKHWMGQHLSQNNESDVDSGAANTDNRFRDNEELRYSLRSIEKYAPWIRHVYLVTDGQVPSWIDLKSEKLSIVKHSEIFPNRSHLPVFSSPAIESNLNNIPGLSDFFLYFNDDVFLGAPVYPEDFVSPSGFQNIYLSWEVPSCSDGCRDNFLGDGYCDISCNVTQCDFDMGDCGCKLNELGELHCEKKEETKPEPLPDYECTQGCSYSWLGDGHCDHGCNNSKCAYDHGDCAVDLSYYGVSTQSIGKNNSLVFVSDTESTLVLNLTSLFMSVANVSHDNDYLIRNAMFFEQNMSMVLLFTTYEQDIDVVTGSCMLNIIGNDSLGHKQEINLWLIRGKRKIFQDKVFGRWSVRRGTNLSLEDWKRFSLSFENKLEFDSLDTTLSIPLHFIDDWLYPITISVKVNIRNGDQLEKHETSKSCKLVSKSDASTKINSEIHDTTEGDRRNRRQCTIDKGFINLTSSIWLYRQVTRVEYVDHTIKCQNTDLDPVSIFVSSGNQDIVRQQVVYDDIDGIICIETQEIMCFDFALNLFPNITDSLAATIPVIRTHHRIAKPLNLSIECMNNDTFWWHSSLHDAFCDVNHPDLKSYEKELLLHRKKRSGVCREQLNSFHKTDSGPVGLRWIYEKILSNLGYNTLEPLPWNESICETDEETISNREQKMSKDTFGDSLRFVNRLYNREFGKSNSPRRVPSHMPHMINRHRMQEMKDKWMEEFEATSSHRFRHPQDMQFSFSYFYFLMNRDKIFRTRIEDIWNDYLDVNRDGILDENEILTVASLSWGDYPPQHHIDEVKDCITPPYNEEITEIETKEGIVQRTEKTIPHITLDNLKKCEKIVNNMVNNVWRPLSTNHMSEKEVTFHMLSENYPTAWNQLQGIRARRTKFVCINDDMKFPSKDVGHALHELFISFWPKRSQFELPFHLRNRYDHIDEYKAAEEKQFWVNMLIGTAFFGTILVFIYIFGLNDKSDTPKQEEKTGSKESKMKPSRSSSTPKQASSKISSR